MAEVNAAGVSGKRFGPIRACLVDDHAVVRLGMSRVLAEDPRIEVVAEFSDGESFYRAFRETEQDVAVVDLSMPGMGGLETIRRATAHYPDARIVAYSMHQEPDYVTRAMESGARGYVPKDAAPESLRRAVREVADGRLYIDPEIAQRMMTRSLQGSCSPFSELTHREFEILELTVQGLAPREIADTLSLSYKSVANHTSNIKQKLGVTSAYQLFRLALDGGLGAR